MNKAAFEKWCKTHYSGLLAYRDVREDIWHYFDREFPREAVESMADRLWHQGVKGLKAGFDERDIWIAKVADEFERLWNGGQLPDKIEQLVCPTCGGRGEVCKYGHELQRPNSPVCDPEPCPDCKLGPQKCFRCGVVNSDNTIISCMSHYADGTDATGGGQIGRHRFVDERKGEERVHTRRGNDAIYGHREAIDFPSSRGRRAGKDRRTKESPTITGSLKAMRPQE